MAEKYIFTGCAVGRFETQDGRKQPFCNMFVISSVSDFSSEDYEAAGYKAEKLKCVDPSVFSGLVPGQELELFFDSKAKVSFAKPTGAVFQFPVKA